MTTQSLRIEDPGAFGAGCCPTSGLAGLATETRAEAAKAAISIGYLSDPSAFVKIGESGHRTLSLMVENLSCAACISKI